MPLTDTQIKNAKPKEKVYRINDFDGLSVEVRVSGKKCWRFRGTHNGKELLISLGVYPEVSLAEARDRCKECRELLAKGINPSANRKEEKSAQKSPDTFERIAREWHKKHSVKWSNGHADKIIHRLEKDVFPFIGQNQINDVLPKDILRVLRIMEDRRATDLARRMHQVIGQIFRYAVALGIAERDNAADLKGALTPVVTKHHSSLTDPKAISNLLRAIEEYEGSHVVRCALRISPILFVRPGELRHAEWDEFDFEAAEWRIPAHKMKMRIQHIVPLSVQALAILEEVKPLTGNERYVFPSARSDARPMSENTINAALRYLGYDTRSQQTAHGFRSMASTLLNEMGWNRDAIERQLAHAERNGVRAAYNFAEYLPERRRMMQAWADYLEQLRDGAKITPLRHVMGDNS